MSETLMPAPAQPEITRPAAAVALPAVIVDAGPAGVAWPFTAEDRYSPYNNSSDYSHPQSVEARLDRELFVAHWRRLAPLKTPQRCGRLGPTLQLVRSDATAHALDVRNLTVGNTLRLPFGLTGHQPECAVEIEDEHVTSIHCCPTELLIEAA